MPRALVFNSSPLITLAKLNLLKTVIKYFTYIYVPPTVVREIYQKRDATTNVIQSLIKDGKIRVVKPEKLFVFSNKIHLGELETINLAKQLNAMAVLDDLVARKLAIVAEIPLTGTLGILKFLKALNIIQINNKELYEMLIRVGFRVTEKLFFEIMEDVK